jgi:choline dehydrogenase-like flavoprotein
LAKIVASSGLLSCLQIGCGALKVPRPVYSGISPALAAQYQLLFQNFPTKVIAQDTGGISPQYVNDTTKLFTTSLAGNFFTLLGVLEHPFSRASVQIKSANASVYPEIDPRYLSHPFNLQVLSRMLFT